MSRDLYSAARESKATEKAAEGLQLYNKALNLFKENITVKTLDDIQKLLGEAVEYYQQAERLSQTPELIRKNLITVNILLGSVLARKGRLIFREIPQKKVTNHTYQTLKNATACLLQAIEKYEETLTLIKSFSTFSSDDLTSVSNQTPPSMVDEAMKGLEQEEARVNMNTGKIEIELAGYLKKESLFFKAQGVSSESKQKVKEALLNLKQASRRFRVCLTIQNDNYHAHRLWGVSIAKQAKIYASFLDDSSQEDTKKYLLQGGESILKAYQINPNDPDNITSMAKFYFQTGKQQLQSAKDDVGSSKIEALAKADQLLSMAISIQHPATPPKYLEEYSELMELVSHNVDTDFVSYYHMVAEEYALMSEWVNTKPFRESISIIKRFGYLTKQGKVFSSWKRRFFVATNKNITYYKAPGGKCLGMIKQIDIRNIAVDTLEDREYCFDIISDQRRYHFQADNEQIMMDWVKSITSIISI